MTLHEEEKQEVRNVDAESNHSESQEQGRGSPGIRTNAQPFHQAHIVPPYNSCKFVLRNPGENFQDVQVTFSASKQVGTEISHFWKPETSIDASQVIREYKIAATQYNKEPTQKLTRLQMLLLGLPVTTINR